MVYKVEKTFEYKGKMYYPGALIKLSGKEAYELKDKVAPANKVTKEMRYA